MKKIKFEFDNHIENIDQLIEQLESLRKDAEYNMSWDEVFQKDYHALKIVINYLKEQNERK